MLLVDDLAAGGTKNLRQTPRGLVTLLYLLKLTVVFAYSICHFDFVISVFKTLCLSTSVVWSLLITCANRLDTDQARQNVGPDLDSICLTRRLYS